MRLSSPNRRVFVTQGVFADDARWISQLAPRPEDCLTGEDFPFAATEILHVVLFFGSEAKDVYDHLGIASEGDAQRVIDTFEWFPRREGEEVPSYRVICYIDEGTAIENDELSGTTDYTDAIDELETQVSAICVGMADYRFEYAGRFDYREESQVLEIAQAIKDHWGIEL